MFLADTNAISELRKGTKADPGVVAWFRERGQEVFLPAQVIGKLRFGVERLRHRGDLPQAQRLHEWFQIILEQYALRILVFDLQCATAWGTLMGLNDQHIVGRQIAAIALVYDLTVVTRNTTHFAETGVRLVNPFSASAPAIPSVY